MRSDHLFERMTFANFLELSQKTLRSFSVQSARIDSLLILSFVTKCSKEFILSNDNMELSEAQLESLNILLAKRANGLPVAYIVGKKEFFGREFHVNENVLIPRPESESFIELLIKDRIKSGSRLLDVGTGSGCLAVSAKLEQPNLSVTACDISDGALEVALGNSRRLGAEVSIIKSDLFENIEGRFDYIFANLPYVPSSMPVSKEVKSEPSVAIFSGQDGLSSLGRFLLSTPAFIKPHGKVFIESLELQQQKIRDIAEKRGLIFIERDSLVQVFQNNAS